MQHPPGSLRLITAAVLALAGAAANAQSMPAPRTRAQVLQELADARRDGTLPVGEAGLTMRELYPGRYPAPPAEPGRTREQVRAELEAAQRNGDLLVSGESGQTWRERLPDLYPAGPVLATRTREQVKAELAEARRTGDLYANGESGMKLNELYPQRYPHERQTMMAGTDAAGVAPARR